MSKRDDFRDQPLLSFNEVRAVLEEHFGIYEHDDPMRVHCHSALLMKAAKNNEKRIHYQD